MSKLTTIVLFIVALILGPFSINAQSITMDEAGKLTFDGASEPPGTIENDPTYNQFTLAYNLSFLGGFFPGVVYLLESGGENVISDVIDFNADGFVYFFSDINDGPLTLADTGIPSSVLPSTCPVNCMTEGTTYTPNINLLQPGFLLNFEPASYTFLSNEIGVPAVPEPATYITLGTCLLACVLNNKKIFNALFQ